MFGIGGQELFLILLLALVILGPKKLPDLARTLGKAMGDFQRATQDLQNEITGAADVAKATPKPSPKVAATSEASSETAGDDGPPQEFTAEFIPEDSPPGTAETSASDTDPKPVAAPYNPDEIEG